VLGAVLLEVEGRAQVGRGVDGAGGSAVAEDHDDDDDKQERERAAEAGGKRHEQRCVITYDARPLLGIESHSTCVCACVGGPTRQACPLGGRVRALIPTCIHSHLGPFPLAMTTLLSACPLWRRVRAFVAQPCLPPREQQ
jgi:hypothetical protein